MVKKYELRSCPNCGSFNIEDEGNLQTHCYDCKENFPTIGTNFPLVEVVKLSDLNFLVDGLIKHYEDDIERELKELNEKGSSIFTSFLLNLCFNLF